MGKYIYIPESVFNVPESMLFPSLLRITYPLRSLRSSAVIPPISPPPFSFTRSFHLHSFILDSRLDINSHPGGVRAYLSDIAPRRVHSTSAPPRRHVNLSTDISCNHRCCLHWICSLIRVRVHMYMFSARKPSPLPWIGFTVS